MANEEFEFYKDLPKSKHDLSEDDFKELNIPGTLDYNPFALEEAELRLDKAAEELVKETEIMEIERTLATRARRRSDSKARSRRMHATVAALLLVAGYGVHAVHDFVKPYVDDAREYERNRIMLADMYENYAKNAGY